MPSWTRRKQLKGLRYAILYYLVRKADRFYGKIAVLTGFVDIKPAKGALYRVRSLEVYTQNSAGAWQMAQKESVNVPLK